MIHIFFIAWSLAHSDPDALKREARAVSNPTGCTQLSQCKVLALGSKPCGGPSEFLVYCSTSTDERLLEAKVRLATDAEKAKNAANQMMGICTALSVPRVKFQNGQCLADEAKAADVPM